MSLTISEKVLVIGTGGTIAGRSLIPADHLAYTAGVVDVAQLLSGVPGLCAALQGRTLVTEQLAQIDSKDMSFALWQQLALRVSHHLAQADVRGVVITHGTDTLEETAYFLHAVLPAMQLARKPVVLTCAMRPASSLAPDGPQNLLDALALVLAPGACGVMAVCAGTVHSAVAVQKVHPYRLDAFGSGDAGPLGFVEEGTLRLTSNWPVAPVNVAQDAIKTIACANCWPRVEIVMNYAGATGAMVDALLMPVSDRCREGLAQQELAPLRGLVVAATGNGTVHAELEAALLRAQEAGVKVVLATRCALGRVLPTSRQAFADSQGLSPVKARVALILALLMAGPP